MLKEDYHKTERFRTLIHTIKTKNKPTAVSWLYLDAGPYRVGDLVDRLVSDAMQTNAEFKVEKHEQGLVFYWLTERQAREAQYG